jgi:DNA-binding SARP family transcriptional activator
MYKRLLHSFICLFCVCGAYAAGDGAYGLEFISHDDIKDNRTSLHLTPNGAMKLGSDFRIEFEMQLRQAEHVFGYVLRMITDQGENIDMVADTDGGLKVAFIDHLTKVTEFPLNDTVYGRWIPVSISIHSDPSEIVFSVDGESQSTLLQSDYSRSDIFFGACDHPDFYTTDVPPMTLRNVRIYNGKEKLLRHWELGNNEGDVTYDLEGKHPAVAVNPVWIIDDYSKWSKKLSVTIPEGQLNMAANADDGMVYFAAGDRLSVYDNSSPDSLRSVRTQNRLPFAVSSNQLIFDKSRGLLVAYDFETSAVSTLNTDELQWSDATESAPMPRYWHHNAAFIPEMDATATFGGYGEHTYKASLNIIGTDGTWEQYNLSDSICPRYLAGMAVIKNSKLLVIGGYGSASGLQSESPHNFYDMHIIDPETREVEFEGNLEHDQEGEHFVFGRDMVEDEDGGVYAIIYSDKRYASEISLIKIDPLTGKTTRYADRVPYQFSDIESFCTLVYDRKNSEFLLVTMHVEGDDKTLVEVWSLKSPPLKTADISTGDSPRRPLPLWLLIGGLALLAAGAIAMAQVVRKMRSRKASLNTGSAPMPDAVDMRKTYLVEKKTSSILLLGGFQVVDKNGNDITGNFTQTIRSLFLSMLLETHKNGRGISSQRLKDTLWFDKDADSARNNRNVNIHKLRTLLQEVGDVDISGENSYWQLKLGEGIFCDYSALLQLGHEIESDCDKTKVAMFMALASLGKLLPNLQTDWGDEYKAEFTSRLIEKSMKIAAKANIKDDPQMLLRIADAILTHDNLDEDAIRMKCTVLIRLGKKNQAKEAYNSFAANFAKALDSTPDFNFADILGSK